MTAAAHVPVMAQEAVAALAVRADGTYVDATFGRGGHSRRILGALGGSGRLIALDRDPEAIAAGRQIADARLVLVKRPFSALGAVLDTLGVAQVDGVLLDLGVSSPQLDQGERGFSFRVDAPLDMRMDTESGMTAAEWLAQASEEDIAAVIRDFGEERYARAIARAVVTTRAAAPIVTTAALAGLVSRVVKTREPGQHPATRTFQALRIKINGELDELAAVLPQCVERLKPGGRLAVISFHSLEDRLVKRFMRAESQGATLPARLPVRASELAGGRLRRVGRALRASADEVAANPRARSAVLRVAERTGVAA